MADRAHRNLLLSFISVSGALWALTVPASISATEPDLPRPEAAASVVRVDDSAETDTGGVTAAPAETAEAAEDANATALYRPRRRGAPRGNVGAGGARGSFAQPRPLALAPDHVGLTQRAAPSLFWHINALPGEELDVVFKLFDEASAGPLAERTIDRPTRTGIQRLRFDRLGVELQPDIDYAWSIALVGKGARRPETTVSVAYIRRVAPDPSFPNGDGVAYARAGFWYDALEALGDAIAARPGDTDLRAVRNALLREAHLEMAVE